MTQQRLAAIMFTDIVGYTTLMGSDEDKAFEILRKNREIHTEVIKQFNGLLIKEMGDLAICFVIFAITSWLLKKYWYDRLEIEEAL